MVAKKVLNLAVMWEFLWVDGLVNYLVERKEDEMALLTVVAKVEHLVL